MTTVKAKTRCRLVVEGHDDRMSVKGLMKWHTKWPDAPEDAPVWIELGKSVSEILKPSFLTSFLKASDYDVLGVMLDADDSSPGNRYKNIRASCLGEFPDLPENLDASGIVSQNKFGKRFGVWIMPDNVAEGCLETFLKLLIPAEKANLWKHACESSAGAKALGADWCANDETKAQLYTWLAWQETPGQSPGTALTKKMLDPKSDSTKSFVGWFINLYSLPAL